MRVPRVAQALLRGFIVDPDLEEAILGDLAEEWNERAGRPGSGPASAWYRRQVLTSVPHLLREWWLQQSPRQAVRHLGRVALGLLLAVSLAAVTLAGMSTAGGGAPARPMAGDPHTLAIGMLLAGAVGAAAGGLFLAWRTARAPMCPVALLGLSWVPATPVAAAVVPSPGPPTWLLAAFPALLLAITLAGGAIATMLRETRRRTRAPLEDDELSTLEEAMEKDRSAYRLAARPLFAAAVLLAVPLVAMQFTDEVAWTLSDFVIMGVLVSGTGVLFELALAKTESTAYRAAAAVALAAAFLLFWVSGAVGIIGAADNPANLMYLGVIAVGIGGAVGAGSEPRGMARAMVAAAVAQALVAAIAIVAGWGRPYSGAVELVFLNGFWIALFLGSAWLFQNAARDRSSADAAPAG